MTAESVGSSDGAPASVQQLDLGTVRTHAQDLQDWRQGDLVLPKATALPLSWLMPREEDPVTRIRNPAAHVRPYYNRSSTAPLVVASQTCDVSGSDTGIHHPFALTVSLTPSAHLSTETANLARAHRVPYLVPSTYVDTLQPSLSWYADLRLVIPVSKGVLLSCEAGRSAFDPNEFMRFTAGLAHKFSRPAVDDVLSVDLPKLIDTYVKNTGPTHAVFRGTEEVRLLVNSGNPVTPGVQARVLVLVENFVLKEARSLWTGWEDDARQRLQKKGVRLGATAVDTAAKLKASIYRQTSALRIPSLGALIWP